MITISQLDSLPDDEFLSLFSGGAALRGFIVSLTQKVLAGDAVHTAETDEALLPS